MPRCISAQIMSPLIEWRNPQEGSNNRFVHYTKVTVSEFALSLLLTTSVVEGIAYKIFNFTSYALIPTRYAPINFFTELCTSSDDTLTWAIHCLLKNYSQRYLYDNELDLKDVIQEIRFNNDINIPNPHLMIELASDWPEVDYEALVDIQKPSENDPEKILEGSDLLLETLEGASQETIQDFTEVSYEIFHYIFTKAVYSYILGQRRDYELPKFFKEETCIKIIDLREDLLASYRSQNECTSFEEFLDNHRNLLQPSIDDRSIFEAGPGSDKELFFKIKEIAYNEVEKGYLVTKCWQNACERLQNQGN